MFEMRRLAEAIEILELKEIAEDERVSEIIKRRYYERAIELHPDKNGSKEDFQRLVLAYELLLVAASENEKLIREILLRRQGTGFRNFQEKKSEEYTLYKKAIGEYSNAIVEYFEKVRKVNLDPADPVYQKLCDRMQHIKKDLFEVVKMNPGGIWASDCIEKISRINVWLKNETVSAQNLQ